MSTAIFPTLRGLAFPVPREVVWDTNIQQNVSGKEVRIPYTTWPRYRWTFDFSVLTTTSSIADFQSLLGFYNLRQGSADSFLYKDPNDYTVSSQSIGTGDSSSTAFQLVKSYGSFIEPVLAPDTSSTINIYKNAVLQAASSYTINAWGSSNPGRLTFGAAPSSGTLITADFQYYYPCRFDKDTQAFNLKYYQIYNAQRFTIISVKS